MTSDVYTFEKTLKERLAEFETVLCIGDESLSPHKISSIWSSYIELGIELCGWNALWKICRRTSAKYCICFPTVVFVVVLSVDCSELSALVEVTAVQNDIHLPKYHRVPITHLYPTKLQRKECLRIEETAECLDQLRFFYNHLWRPWDDIDGHCKSDWPTMYLQVRIDLLEEMQSNSTCREKWEYLRCLLQEAKDIKQNIEFVEYELSEDKETPADITCLLMKYHLRLNQIKTEVKIFENPLTRSLLTRQKKPTVMTKNDKSAWIVFLGQSIQSINESMPQALKYFSPTTFINSCSTVQRALDCSFENKVILLCSGHHKINKLDVQHNCILRGFAGQPLTSVVEAEGSCVLDCPGISFTLEDLIINCESTAATIIVRSGTLKVHNCHFKATVSSFSSPAIIALQGTRVEISNCSFSNLGTALIVCSGAIAQIASSEISSCAVGMQVSNDAILVTDGLKIIKSKDCAMKIDNIREEIGQKKTGTVDIIAGFRGIRNNNLTIKDTIGDDVIVIQNEDVLTYE